MPYNTTSELPDSVKENLPDHALEIYKEAFNSAWEQYKDSEDRRGGTDREEVSHKVAWSAVKKVYEKEEDGEWRAKNK
jgi:cation transport regulator